MFANATHTKQHSPSNPCRFQVVSWSLSGRFHVGLTSLSPPSSTSTQTPNPM